MSTSNRERTERRHRDLYHNQNNDKCNSTGTKTQADEDYVGRVGRSTRPEGRRTSFKNEIASNKFEYAAEFNNRTKDVAGSVWSPKL